MISKRPVLMSKGDQGLCLKVKQPIAPRLGANPAHAQQGEGGGKGAHKWRQPIEWSLCQAASCNLNEHSW